MMAAETKKKAPGNEVSVIPITFSLTDNDFGEKMRKKCSFYLYGCPCGFMEVERGAIKNYMILWKMVIEDENELYKIATGFRFCFPLVD